MSTLQSYVNDETVAFAMPIPNAPVNDRMPGLEKIDNYALLNRLNALIAIQAAPVMAIYKMLNGKPIGNIRQMSDSEIREMRLLNAEWDRRLDYWNCQKRNEQLEAHNSEVQLREEIIEALMEEGKARHVAANLTNTEAKMLAEGKRLNII